MSKICGIYLIKNPNGRYYVGQSKNIKRRFSEYVNLKNIGAQPKLHRSFLKYSVKSHIFYILEVCDEEFLNCSERYWQEKFDVVSEGLNCIFVDCGCEKRTGIQKFGKDNPNFGKKWSEEKKKKQSEIVKSKVNDMLTIRTTAKFRFSKNKYYNKLLYFENLMNIEIQLNRQIDILRMHLIDIQSKLNNSDDIKRITKTLDWINNNRSHWVDLIRQERIKSQNINLD